MLNYSLIDCYYDSSPINRIYLGDEMVWERYEDSVEGTTNYAYQPVPVNMVYRDNETETIKQTPVNYTFSIPIRKRFSSLKISNQYIITITKLPNTSDQTDMSSMFSGCIKLESVNLSNIDTSNCIKMNSMFVGLQVLTELDLSKFDTSKVINMMGMFQNCRKLAALDLSNFDTSNVQYMGSMFKDCFALTELDLRSFNTSMVGSMAEFLSGCSNLTTLKLSLLDLSKVSYAPSAFSTCVHLTNIIGTITGIKFDINLIGSSFLTNASAMVFINGLANVDTAKTISFHKNTYLTLTEQQIAIATSKGWTVASS